MAKAMNEFEKTRKNKFVCWRKPIRKKADRVECELSMAQFADNNRMKE